MCFKLPILWGFVPAPFRNYCPVGEGLLVLGGSPLLSLPRPAVYGCREPIGTLLSCSRRGRSMLGFWCPGWSVIGPSLTSASGQMLGTMTG